MKLLTLYAIKATEHGGYKAEMELLGLGYYSHNPADGYPAFVLRDYTLDINLDGEKNYKVYLELIREAGEGFFCVTGNATCRHGRKMAIVQQKELPWEYLFQCMKLSAKDFLVKLPDYLHDDKFRANSEGEVFVYAWYDAEIDAIQVFANTG